ncbi:MAG: RluA family pseudouridine synthase [Planctomycetota bacterium]
MNKAKKNQGYVYRLQVQDVQVGESLLNFLARRFQHSSYDEWKCRLRAGEIFVDGKVVGEDQGIATGARIDWHRPGWVEEPTPQHFDLLYQDEHLLVVSKPSGLPTMPAGGFLENTLLHLVRTEYGPVQALHRLGRGTSGVVLFAKTSLAASRVTKNWSECEKSYWALASGRASESSYDIQQPIGPVAHPRLGTVHAASANGKPARSIAKALRRTEDKTLFEVQLLTGRPHQIRIHLASIGLPLVGDPVYASGGGLLIDPGLPSDLGYLLHARSVTLRHPITSEQMSFETPLPAELLEFEKEKRFAHFED